MTNAARAKVWDAAYEPFGRARVFTSTVEMNLRLPGQQLHAETGLHQNWMRDYDPMVGRYLQPDPIGLEGGPNVYGYVGGDPLNYVDPRGEDAVVVLQPGSPKYAGHVGMLVGHENGGFTYYSDDGPTFGAPAMLFPFPYPTPAPAKGPGPNGEYFRSLDDFFRKYQNYSNGVRLPTTAEQDWAMHRRASRAFSDPYYAFPETGNCLDSVSSVLRAGGIAPPRFDFTPAMSFAALQNYPGATPVRGTDLRGRN